MDICDKIKQNQSEVGNIAENISCFPIVFAILQLLISLKPIDQFQWGFVQNIAVKNGAYSY